MSLPRLPPKLITAILLSLFMGVSLFLRIYLPYKDIFVGDWIKFSSNDAYYYMRIVDNLARTFPHISNFDPYVIYPGGSGIGSTIFFAWLLAGLIWVIGLGSPTPHLIDLVSAYFPVALAALTIIPVYFIGKHLFNRWAGIIAAALMAITPGEFMGRSILAFTDHHVAETLFSTVIMLFLVLAIKSAGQSQLTFDHIRRRDRVATRTLVYALLAGFSIGIYLLTWVGGLLFVFIITIYIVVQSVIDHLRGRSTDYLTIISVPAFLIATIMVAPFSGVTNIAAMVIALLVAPVLSGISRVMNGRSLKLAYYPLTVIAAGAVALGVFYAIAPSLVLTMLGYFSIFAPSGPSTTTLEMQPLFSAGASLAWGNFPGLFGLAGLDSSWTGKNVLILLTSEFSFSIITLLILAYLVIFKRGSPERSLMVVWSLVILAAVWGQRRFAYYYAVNVALLVGYLSWQVIWRSGLNALADRHADEVAKTNEKSARHRAKRKVKPQLTMALVYTVLAATVIFWFVLFANIPAAVATAKNARFAPSNAWYSALTWMKDNTPEPLGSPDAYYQLYRLPPGQGFTYPKSAYGVTSWWDYGYWITRIAHRLPSVNHSQPPEQIINVTHLFLAQDESSARATMQTLDSRYIIIDYDTAYINVIPKGTVNIKGIPFIVPERILGKFFAVAMWSGKRETEFYELYYVYVQEIKQAVPIVTFYPEYYGSLSSRLYNFDGKAVTPQSTLVISWEARQTPQGNTYKEITSAQAFSDYNAATTYVQTQKTGNHKIVGSNPLVSPVPLEALKDFKLAYASAETVTQADVGPVPEVKVFQYTPSAQPPGQK